MMDREIGETSSMEEGIEFLAIAGSAWFIGIFFEAKELDGHGSRFLATTIFGGCKAYFSDRQYSVD